MEELLPQYTDRVIYLQFSRNLSQTQWDIYRTVKSHLHVICLLKNRSGKEKSIINWIRIRLFRKGLTAGKHFKKKFHQNSLPRQQPNSFFFQSLFCQHYLLLGSSVTRQIDIYFVYRYSQGMGWKSLGWYDLTCMFKIMKLTPRH